MDEVNIEDIAPERPPLDLPTELPTTAIPGTASDKKTAGTVLASQMYKVTSKTIIDALMMGDYTPYVEFTKEVLKDAYRMRFITSPEARDYLAYTQTLVRIWRQYDIQKNIYKQNPEALIHISTMAESVLQDGSEGMLRLGYKCPTIKEAAPNSYAEMLETCYKCNQRDEDERRVLKGLERKCPIGLPVPDYFQDIEEILPRDKFKTQIRQWEPHWWRVRYRRFKKLLKEWREIDFGWYTQQMKIEEHERWRRENPVGILMTEQLHEPALRLADKFISYMEGRNWKRWSKIKKEMDKEKK